MNRWDSEPGGYCRNYCCNLRVIDALRMTGYQGGFRVARVDRDPFELTSPAETTCPQSTWPRTGLVQCSASARRLLNQSPERTMCMVWRGRPGRPVLSQVGEKQMSRSSAVERGYPEP
jgi:hypothetical protein